MRPLSLFRRSSFVAPFALVAIAGCGGGSSSGTSDDGGLTLHLPDAKADSNRPASDGGHPGTDAGGDAKNGAISTHYPAFTVDMPTVVNNGGGVLVSPVVVTITWPGQDSNVATWEAMSDGMGSSAYWTAAAVPYGVGAAVGGDTNHVHMTQSLPTSLGYTDLDNFVLAAVTASMSGPPDAGVGDDGKSDGGTTKSEAGVGDAGDAARSEAGSDAGQANPTWPAPVLAAGTAETIYSLFIPQSISVTDPGSGVSFCDEGALGYHTNVMAGSTPVAYSVSLECAGQSVPDVEETLAHELVEAATNPYPSTNSMGYVGFDADHLAWDIYTGYQDELADACENWADSYYESPAPYAYWVQRIWSNTNAAAGHAPCAPLPGIPYQGVTLFPAAQTMSTLYLASIGLPNEATRTFVAKVGDTVTFQVGFYSDSAAAAPLAISYDFPSMTQLFDTSGNPLGNGAATVSIDLTSGENGQIANVSVTPTMAGPLGFQIMAITWDAPTGANAMFYIPHYLPILISNQ